MKRLSKGSQFAIFALLFIGITAIGFGIYDYQVSGSAPGVFVFAGIMLALALLTFLLSKRTDIVPAVALLLLLGTSACATTPGATASVEPRSAQEGWETITYPAADGYDQTEAVK